ncbi:MAG: phosphoenolpyruvate carboxykinase (ATP) [Eubacteriales bacterium]|nr:phosphoenolpyruvate carboxykinase (ATP) [Eubacteriales bacterium]
MKLNTYSPEELGLDSPAEIHANLNPPQLVEAALRRGEGKLNTTGAVVVTTGKYTGRSPDDKFIVDTPGVHDKISWGKVNRPVTREVFDALKKRMIEYFNGREVFVFDGLAGADRKYTRKFRIINELASQNLFIHQLLVRPTAEELMNYGEPDYTVLCAPGFKCVPERDHTHSEAAIIIDYEAHCILIAGTGYAGEIKKSVFSTMNYVMPLEENVLPMHSSANMDPETGESAVFFGLSGTGKTTLSADPARVLIGDDEHGWSEDGIFNFEGGCYAKCINLDKDAEPEIYGAVKFGSVVENVVMDPDTRELDYFDSSLTENTRCSYPITSISNATDKGTGGIPKVIIFLTADAYGVLPPVSRLSKEAAMYHFVTGFTSKLAGTERGIKEPTPTFSTLFGQPFMPLNPRVYAEMLGEKMEEYNTKVYLVNTGWSGGSYGTGARIKLRYTRAMVTAALNGSIEDAEYRHDDRFNVEVPQSVDGVPAEILNPRETWADKAAYDETADMLAEMFHENFETKYNDMPEEVKKAGPRKL